MLASTHGDHKGSTKRDQTLWIFSQLTRPRQRPVTNVVAVFVIAITAIPILWAYYLTKDTSETAGGGK